MAQAALEFEDIIEIAPPLDMGVGEEQFDEIIVLEPWEGFL